MWRCLQLAKNGLGSTYPNPMVGCILVHDDLIIGEGWHQKIGQPHAEVNAILNVENPKLLKESTLYVSLEPCSHFGKTPPCADFIISKRIKNVVIGSLDSNPKVSGNGIQKLKDADCEVITNVLRDECAELNKRFFTFHNKKRPYIILKWAQTLDGFIAPEKNEIKTISEKKPFWITCTLSRQRAHQFRAEEHAILVGTKTVIEDNPELTTRAWEGKNPIRIVLDRTLKIPKQASILNNKAKTLVFTEIDTDNAENIIFEKIDFSSNIATQVCASLHKHQIQSVIIEGGAKTLQTFIDENMWDEAFVFTGNKKFKKGIKSPLFSGEILSKEKIESDLLVHFKNPSH